MAQSKEQYLKILKLELTNLIGDISDLIDYEKELHDNNKHTNFVYLENLVVLKDEIMGINGILGKIDEISTSLSEDNYIKELISSIHDFVEKRGYPPAVMELIKRKIKKIEDFGDIL